MEELVKEELNVKEIEYVSTMSDYVSYEVRPNLPVAGPKYGKHLRGIIGALGHADAAEVARIVETQGKFPATIDGRQVVLDKEDIDIRIKAREGFAVEVENDTFVILDTEIGQDLEWEGIAREIVSKVQTMRRNLGFNVTDHINMAISSDEDVICAVKRHLDYIKGDTLCDNLDLASGEIDGDRWDINGHQAIISVKRVEP